MGQELKTVTRKFVVVLGLISCFLKVPRYFREKAILARALLPAPCPHPKEALIFEGSNPQIPLHFFEFHFPGTSQLVSPTCFHGDSSREKRTRRGAPDKVLWWAPISGLQPRRQLPLVRIRGLGTHFLQNSSLEGTREPRKEREEDRDVCVRVCP